MSLWRQFTRGLRTLLNRKAADRDIADEVASYLEEAGAGGISAVAMREEVRSYGWENAILEPLSDVRYAARRLWGNPGFTAISVITLALGIGASTAIFSVIEGVLLKPLPYPHSERLAALTHTAPGINIKELNMAASLYFTYSEENRVFEDVAMWQTGASTVTGVAEPEEVPGITVTNAFLPTLGVQAALGRRFTASDDDPKSERKVMISDGYWRSRFGGDRGVLGRRIIVDGDAREVIGVLPAGFRFMDRPFSLVIPLRFDRADVKLIGFCCRGIALLKPGVTLPQANADVARMLAMAPAKFPMNPGWSRNAFSDARIAPRLQLLRDVLAGDIGSTLWVLMGTVGIVLLIACANVANLLLVRADGRQQEFAVRAALGAGWGRLARELLLESVLLGVAGGALGLALASCALRVLVASDVPHLPRIHDISIDPAVLAFALGVSLVAALVFGLIPVFKYARPQLASGLRGAGRSLTSSRERHRARGMLVVVQVALALVLLIGSGLMVRTFRALHQVDPGFSGAPELETMRIYIPEKRVREPERAIRMEEEILRKIESLGGVFGVAITNVTPLEGNGSNNPVFIKDKPGSDGAIPPIRRFKFISPGYVSAMGSRLIAGRDLTWAELYSQTPVALISENMAREVWQDPRAALGKQIRSSLTDDWRQVIGVVSDLRDDGIDQKAPGIVYWPLLMKNFGGGGSAIRSVVYLIRTPRAGSMGLLRDIQQAVASVNANVAVADVKTLETVYERSMARTSFTLVLPAIAGGMAMLVGVVGIYGVISYAVSQRRREIGIRMALGAPLRDVTGLFVRNGLAMSGVGAMCGLAAALGLTRLMKSLLFEVSPADPLTYLAAAVTLIGAALVGSYLPARRATRVDPAEALRAE